MPSLLPDPDPPGSAQNVKLSWDLDAYHTGGPKGLRAGNFEFTENRELSFSSYLLWSLVSCPVAFGQLLASVTESWGRSGCTLGRALRGCGPCLYLKPLGEVSGWPGPGCGGTHFPGHPCLSPPQHTQLRQSFGCHWTQLRRAQMNQTSRNWHSEAWKGFRDTRGPDVSCWHLSPCLGQNNIWVKELLH